MKKVLILILVCGALFFPVGKMVRRSLAKRAKSYSSYKPLEFSKIKECKPFVIVIPSYNNEEYVERNLASVLDQEYENYRVIYIDDCSTDKTYEKALSCIERSKKNVTLIRNAKNQKALHNLYDAVHSCHDKEIVVLLDGDDWLAHKGVLKELNRYYNDPRVWLTYGQYMTYPNYELGICREPLFKTYLKKGNLRKVGLFSKSTDWFFSHLRTFYAGLFKKIQKEDLLYKGEFFSSAWDFAILFPMVEMAREHAIFIPSILYIYNRETPFNDDKLRAEEQYKLNLYIRSMNPYKKIQKKIDLFE
jgi:glycosyltransferase involved in cell wall biosynthesis